VNVKVHRGRPLIASFGKRARCLGDDPCYRDPDGVGCLQALRSCRCDDISGRTAVSVDRREHERACRQRFDMLARLTAHYRGGLSQHQAQRRCAHNGMILWSQEYAHGGSKIEIGCVHLPSIATAACLWSRAPIRAAMSVAFGLHSAQRWSMPARRLSSDHGGGDTGTHTTEQKGRIPSSAAEAWCPFPSRNHATSGGCAARMPRADQRSRELV
jgi:hypothetical protein